MQIYRHRKKYSPFRHSESLANCWPTKEQELLLRACLLKREQAIEAWNEWRKVFKRGGTDSATRRLLPALYDNLRKHKISGPLVKNLKEEYYRTWAQNKFAFSRAAEVVDRFHEAGIKTLLLKGSGLISTFYEDPGLRPMADIDLLVHRSDALRSICLLETLGWSSKYKTPSALVPFENANEFTDHVNQKLDLHWRVMWEGSQKSTDDDFWEASIPVNIGGVLTRTLNPSDHLLHVCVHGAKWNDTAPIRWIIDAMKILTSEKSKVDWERLIRQARDRRLALPMGQTLGYLTDTLEAPVPPEVLRELQSEPRSARELIFYKIRLSPNSALKTIPVTWHWLECLVIECRGNLIERLAQFLKYLQSLWGLETAGDVPLHFIGRVNKRVYELVESRFQASWNSSEDK
jgi:hypothetical protein